MALLLLGGVKGASCGDDATGDHGDARPRDAALVDGTVDAATDGGCELGVPGEPNPATQSVGVDPMLQTELQWAEVAGATAYDVYLGTTCPPPSYPDAAFEYVGTPALSGLSLDYDASYCWQVVARAGACRQPGPVWAFETGSPCSEAPGCAGAETPPADPPHLPGFDLNGFRAPIPPPPPAPAPPLCHAPRLRIQLSRIMVHEDLDDFTNDVVYCVTVAEAPAGAEVRITPMTPPLDQGESYTFALEGTVIWGQLLGPVAPSGDLLITYECLESDDPTAYADLLAALEIAAASAGAVAGDQGWVYPAGGGAAAVSAVSAALAVNPDDRVFQAQQVVPEADHLSITNGGWWSVRRSGTLGTATFDWELFVQAWGCVDNGTL